MTIDTCACTNIRVYTKSKKTADLTSDQECKVCNNLKQVKNFLKLDIVPFKYQGIDYRHLFKVAKQNEAFML